MTDQPLFALDKHNAKWLGVCSGIARSTGIDATFVRVGVVVLTLCTCFTVGLVAYVVAAIVADVRD